MFDALVVNSGAAQIAGERAGPDSDRGPASRNRDGNTIAFLHAGVADKRMWRPQLENLRDEFRVVSYDRRGFGATTTPDEPFSHVEDLQSVLTHVGAAPATLVGCSQGGRIAIDFALAHPESVGKLVLMGPAVSGAPNVGELADEIQILSDELDAADEANDLKRINEIEAHLWLDGPTSPEGRVGGELRDLFLDMNRIALHHAELTREIEPPAAYGRLSELRCPTLVIWGDLDFPDVIDLCTHLVEVIPDATGITIPGTAHLPNLEQPKLVNGFLRDFFA